MDQEQIHNVSMEEIILRQLSSLQLYQVPVALRMTLLEDGLCLLNFWIFKIQNFCLPKLVFVFLEQRLYSNGHKPLGRGYWLRACYHKKLCTNPLDLAVFVQLSFRPFHVAVLRGPGPLLGGGPGPLQTSL